MIRSPASLTSVTRNILLVSFLSALAGCGPKSSSPLVNVDINRGAGIYFKYCVPCHGNDGQSISPLFPPLAGSEWVKGDAQIIAAILLNGISGPFTVRGENYRGVMPAWRSVLNDAEIADVIAFIRVQWGASAPAIGPEDVARIRKLTATRQSFWTEQELSKQPFGD